MSNYLMDVTPLVFVFGSNQNGIHGGGAAKAAHDNYGAVMGRGFGHHGQSFAIPTKGYPKGQYNTRGIGVTLPLNEIDEYVQRFINYAYGSPILQFQVTRIGCGLAGLKDRDIAPMFEPAPNNCFFDTSWERYLSGKRGYWGHVA